ncbi:arsenical pump-driving ATPase [Raineyella antarctica]|nr:arsenical pump-driving ATPase [Raineyella antarctica]
MTLDFLADVPRFLFFTGKGGVGKTSLACATAVSLADAGQRVLLVSTDPASNVGQVFSVELSNTPTAIPAVPGLEALEIDPEAAAEAYREKIVGPVRGLLPETEIAAITESLSGSCTTEIASFNEFTGFLSDPVATAAYDHVIFDTAPTGHTIRLLELPGDWSSFIETGKGDASCLGPMSGLEKHRDAYASAVAALGDPDLTRLVLVARADPPSLAEAARAATELADRGMRRQYLVVNAVLPAGSAQGDELAEAIGAKEQAALQDLPTALADLPRDLVGLKPGNVVGVAALRGLLAEEQPPTRTTPADLHANVRSDQPADLPSDLPDGLPIGLDALVEELAQDDHGLVMCMGKGGVGKTTVAAAIAVALAERGHRVHLSTTDPAGHPEGVVRDAVENLTVTRIDPDEAITGYRDRVMRSKGAGLDAEGRAQLAEDLRSPCTAEVAVFHAFSRIINEAGKHFVVVDTAPTGHTLLLLDTTGSYHREVTRNMVAQQHFTTPMMRLQDPELTRLILVTLPETTPVLEALEFEQDLARADLHPWAWVVNESLAAARTTSPLLRARAAAEVEHLQDVAEHAERVAVLPMMAAEPTGAEQLRRLSNLAPQSTTTR